MSTATYIENWTEWLASEGLHIGYICPFQKNKIQKAIFET